MDCHDFHETYSELLDGLLQEADEIRCREHLAACCWCRRFDQAYRFGVAQLKELPCPRSSRAFTARVLNSVRSDPGGRIPSMASGFAGAALVAALIGFLAIDLRVLEHLGSGARAWSPDTTLAAAPDSGLDRASVRPWDAGLVPPLWYPSTTIPVRDAGWPSGALIAVPAAWAGR
jgi:anti-sigma factor RsiW